MLVQYPRPGGPTALARPAAAHHPPPDVSRSQRSEKGPALAHALLYCTASYCGHLLLQRRCSVLTLSTAPNFRDPVLRRRGCCCCAGCCCCGTCCGACVGSWKTTKSGIVHAVGLPCRPGISNTAVDLFGSQIQGDLIGAVQWRIYQKLWRCPPLAGAPGAAGSGQELTVPPGRSRHAVLNDDHRNTSLTYNKTLRL